MGICKQNDSKKQMGSHARNKNNGNSLTKNSNNMLEITEVNLKSRKMEAYSGRIKYAF